MQQNHRPITRTFISVMFIGAYITRRIFSRSAFAGRMIPFGHIINATALPRTVVRMTKKNHCWTIDYDYDDSAYEKLSRLAGWNEEG